MSIVTYASGTQTAVIGTEHFLSSPNVAGKFRLLLDLNTLAANDVLEVRAYKIVGAGGQVRVAWVEVFYGAQPTNALVVLSEWMSNVLTDTNAVRFSVTQAFGTGRAIPWSVQHETDQADVTKIGGVAQSATDLKDFADTGYDPVTHKVQGVALTDTATNLTNAAANGDLTAAMKASVNTEVDTALADYDSPTNAEMVARTIPAADYFVVGDYTAPANASIADILTVIQKLDGMLALDGLLYQFTVNALENAPSSGGGGGATAEEVRIEMDANSTRLAAIQSKTDTINNFGNTIVDPYNAYNQDLTMAWGEDRTETSPNGAKRLPNLHPTFDLTDADSVELSVRVDDDRKQDDKAIFTIIGEVVDAENADFEFSAEAHTELIKPGKHHIWSMWAIKVGKYTPVNGGQYIVVGTAKIPAT